VWTNTKLPDRQTLRDWVLRFNGQGSVKCAVSPQTNGICERFHKTVLNDEFYHVACRKSISLTDELQGRSGRMDQRT
jgi:hypothetical protein